MSENDRGTDSAAREPYPSPAHSWYVVAVLTLIYVFSFLDRSILSLLVEPIKADLGISDTEMSYLMGTAFAVFYALFGLPLGRLADSTHRVRLIAAGLFVWNFATAGCGLARSYVQLFVMRVGVGIGEATLGPSAYSILSDLFPRQKLATAVSAYSTGIYLGAGISTIIGGFVAAFAQGRGDVVLPLVGAVRAWQVVFFVIGGLGLLPLVLLLLTVKEPVRRGLVTGAPRVPFAVFFGYWKSIRGAVGLHHVAFTVLAISSYGVGGWVPAFMVRTYGWPIGKVGLWVGLNAAITATIGILTGGALADRWVRQGREDGKIRVGLLSALVWLPTGLAFPLMPNGWACMALLVPTTFFSSLATGCAAAAVQEIFPNRMRGQASAIYLFVANLIGLGAGPTLIAVATDFLFQDEAKLRYSMVLVGGTAHLIAGFCFFRCLRPYRAALARLESYASPG